MNSEPLILPATDDDLARFGNARWPDDESRRLWFHLAKFAPNGAWVAKDEGTPIGIAIAHALEDEWFLSELFVEPSFRKQGLGKQLLAHAAADAVDVGRSAVVKPSEADGVAFLLQRGVALQTPLVHISGALPQEEELARMAVGEYRFSTRQLEPLGQRLELGALDREIRGSARPLDHQYFAKHAHGVGFYLRDEFIGYTYVWPTGRVGPMCAASAAYLVQLFAFALAALARVHGASWCTAFVPGSNIRVLRAATRLGLTVESASIFASDVPLLELSRYIGFHPLLF
ncbi:MAG: GNAT family N-acetyltransferase [Candidatus Eremiobacteraeota bacterium]|nr:GNAT family N-acetyltransferase [Candidatus Eremiobacteraeota bacterium]